MRVKSFDELSTQELRRACELVFPANCSALRCPAQGSIDGRKWRIWMFGTVSTRCNQSFPRNAKSQRFLVMGSSSFRPHRGKCRLLGISGADAASLHELLPRGIYVCFGAGEAAVWTELDMPRQACDNAAIESCVSPPAQVTIGVQDSREW
jgi:hypothetical protein